MYDSLVELFDTFLGDSKRGITDGGQIQYNCPCCSIDSGRYDGDGKYNLEINFRLGVFRCWVCDEVNNMKGKISYLIKNHGNKEILEEYNRLIIDLKLSKLYEFSFNNNEEFGESIIKLPTHLKPIYHNIDAYNYLKNRNINDNIIDNYNISCIGWHDDWRLRNRIIVPSYNIYGNLNYYTGRLFIDNKFSTKYYNVEIEKNKIIFNERFIDWDGDIRLVEGVFDHIVVPNSIPLLGKVLDVNSTLYKELMNRTKGTITIFLDGDANKYIKNIYKILNTGNLYNKIKYIQIPYKLDPAKIYELYGYKGIIKQLKNSRRYNEIDLLL